MICPCCSVAEVSKKTDVCELCGYSIAANVATKASGSDRSPSAADPSKSQVKVAETGTTGTGTAISITLKDSRGKRLRKGGDRVVVAVTGANRGRPAVTDVGNGTYTATYTPTHAGSDLLAITVNGVPVEGSPFATEVAPGSSDAAQTVATVPEGVAGKVTAIIISARDASGNPLTGGGLVPEVLVTGANDGAAVKVTDNGTDTYTANYTPEKAGTDEITIIIDGTEIVTSPFESVVRAGDAVAAMATVRLPEHGTPGQGVTVMVTARDKFGNRLRRGGAKVEVAVKGANKGTPPTTDVGNGTYTATYTPTSVGADKITVKLGGRTVKGSPFTIAVSAGAADPLQTTAAIPGVAAGAAAEIVVTARDAHGNAIKSGGDAVSVEIKGANKLKPPVEDLGDGTYLASYVPTVAGNDKITIAVGGTDINGSPFDAVVDPGTIEPANTVVLGDHDGRAGESFTCTVSARDGFNNVLVEGGHDIDATVDGVNADRAVDVADNDDGTYSCSYVPAAAGEDAIRILIDGQPIGTEVFPVTVAAGRPAAKHTVATIDGSQAGDETSILIQSRDEFGNDATDGGHIVDVVIVGANEDERVHITDNQDGTYLATYRPTATGTDYISVNLDGAVIGDSPISCLVSPGGADPAKTLATLPSVCRAGARTNVFVTAVDAFGNPTGRGGDAVVVSLTGPNDGDDVTVVDQKNGTYLAHFTPRATGDGAMIVTINGTQIGDSPLEYHVTSGAVDPLQTVAEGPDAGSVGTPYELLVVMRDQFGNPAFEGGHTVVVEITGANDGMEATVVNNRDGTHRATYIPEKPGRDRLAITVDGKHIGGEPLRPVIGVGGASVHSTADVGHGKAGKVTTIQITARDAAGNETSTGGDSVVVDVSVANSARPDVIDHGDGTYTASYTPTSTGTDYVVITINGAPLVGSPFQSRIAAGPTDAVQTVADVPPSTVAGHATEIIVSMRDVHGNEVTHGGQMVRVSVEGANDGQSLQVTDNQDGTFAARYTPTVAGRDQVAISVNGKPVGGGTFTSVVKPAAPSVAQTTAQIPPGTVGNLTSMTVTLRDAHRNLVAGSDALRVEMEGSNAGTPLQITDNRDGNYTVTYVPTIAGTDKLRVYIYEDEVRESPFAGTVSAGKAASDRTVALVPDGVAGEQTQIDLTARDAFGNPLATQDGVDISIKGANEDAPAQVNDRGDGTYEVTYRPVVAGVDRIVINVNGSMIRGGPFTSTVDPARVDPTHCTATVPAGTVGTPSTVSVLMRDVFDNDITTGGDAVDVQVTGANVGTPVQVSDRGNGTYAAIYTPMSAGTDDIAITVNGHAIGGSPFASKIVAGRIETGAPSTSAGVMSEAMHTARRALQPTMVCPRCSAADISPDTHQCELCGLVLLNVLVPKGALERALEEAPVEVDERELDAKERVEADLGQVFQLESILRQTPTEITYLAKNRTDAQRGVLKVTMRDTVDEAGVAEFEREIDRARDLRHVHVVEIRAHGVSNSCVWYWSDYVPGRTFLDVMRESGQMKIEACLNWVEQIGAALDYIHRRGVVHGNLKPSNILVDAENWCRVTDPFLVPRDLTTGEGEQAEYLSPEQLEVEPLSSATDQYALALLVYTCLTGSQPFSGASGPEARELRREGPAPILEVRPDLPASVGEALDRALNPAPAARFSRVTDFIEALTPTTVVAPSPPRPSVAAAPVLSPAGTFEDTEDEFDEPQERPRVFVIHGPPRAFPSGSIFVGAIAVLAVAMGFEVVDRTPTGGWTLVNPMGESVSPVAAPEPSPAAVPPRDSAPVVVVQPPTPEPEPETIVVTRPPAPRDTAQVVVPTPEPDSVVTPPPDPVTPSRFGYLTVTSTPAATLFVDGRRVGNTPGNDLLMDVGTYTVSIRLFGYHNHDMEVTIEPGQRLTLPNVVLRPIR